MTAKGASNTVAAWATVTVMAQPDLTDPLGVRDRAVLETLYSTGMRRMELVNLEVTDLDRERGTVLIRQGKRGPRVPELTCVTNDA